MTALLSIQGLIKDYLHSDPFFRDFAIITEDDGSIETMIDKSLRGILAGPTGKVGCSIFISTLGGRSAVANTPGTFFEQVTVAFEVVEHRLINRNANHSPSGTLVAGLEVAETLAAIMKNFQTSELIPEPHFREDDQTIEPPDVLENGCVLHTVRMITTAGNVDSTEVVGAPSISLPPAGSATITTGTGGNVTLYTLDGSRPAFYGTGNANNVGTVYSGPVAVGAGTTIKARSFHTGMLKRGSLISSAVGTFGIP
jgi:hypothetical protein